MENYVMLQIWEIWKTSLYDVPFSLYYDFRLMRASVFAQTTVTAKFRNVTLNEVLWEIQKQTDFTFIYKHKSMQRKSRVENLDVKK